MLRDTTVILVCAGNATRMGGIHKILHPLGCSTVLEHSLRTFCNCESVAELVVVCRAQDADEFAFVLRTLQLNLPVRLAVGGATRQQSVQHGFAAIAGDAQYVAMHDGARPLVAAADVERVIADARRYGAATLGVPTKDTMKIVRAGVIVDTPNRAELYQTQTPQVFARALYARALARAAAQGEDFTDDCQLVEALGNPVHMTEGSYCNLKLTTPEDFVLAEALLANCNVDREEM